MTTVSCRLFESHYAKAISKFRDFEALGFSKAVYFSATWNSNVRDTDREREVRIKY